MPSPRLSPRMRGGRGLRRSPPDALREWAFLLPTGGGRRRAPRQKGMEQ